MKAMFSALIVIFVSLSTLAMDQGQIVEPIDQQPSLEGNWEIQNRYCYSGAPVRDAFVFGRDTMELNFGKSSFRSFSDVQGCISHSRGVYELRRGNIIVDIDRSVSSCSPNGFVGTAVNAFTLRAHRLTVTVGPFNNGGSCPRGDSMGLVYTRFQ